MTKNELRKQFKARREQVSQAEYDELNQQLLQRFTSLDLGGVSCVHLFLPIRKFKEPDTFLIREWLKEHHPHIQRLFPKANFADHTIQNYADDDQLELAVNAFGIPEPVSGNLIPIQQVDLMLIPLLAHDQQGYRVGYGKGFYDRLMAQCRPGTRFIGLSFFEAVDRIDDVNEYDMKMYQTLTPSPNSHPLTP